MHVREPSPAPRVPACFSSQQRLHMLIHSLGSPCSCLSLFSLSTMSLTSHSPSRSSETPARCSVFLRCLSKGKIDDLIYGRCRRALNPPHRLSPCETFSSERPLFIRGTKKMNRAGVLLFTETSCENGRLALLPRLGGGVMHRSQVKWNENVE